MGLSRIGSVLSGWPRRLLALSCLLIAAVSAAQAQAAKPTPVSASVDVVVATHDLSPGATIGAADVRVASWPVGLRPATAITSTKIAVGRRLVGTMGAGELITANRLIGTDMAAGLPAGMVAVPVPLVDSSAVSLLHAGDYVDLLSPPADTTHSATVIAQGALVLAVVARDQTTSSSAQLVVAVDRGTELRIAQVITSPMLATLIKPP